MQDNELQKQNYQEGTIHKKWQKLFASVFGKAETDRYFSRVKVTNKNDYLVIDFDNLDNAHYVRDNYYDSILLVINKIFNSETQVKITYLGENLANKPLIIDVVDNNVICDEKLVLNCGFSFSTLIIDESNSMAFKFAQTIVEKKSKHHKRDGSINLFVGDHGVGKTHLLRAIHNHSYEAGHIVSFFSGERFASNFIASIKDNSVLDFKNNILNSEVLIIDDLDFLLGKNATMNELENIVHNMFLDGKAIIFSGHKNKKEYLDKLPRKLKHLFEESLMIDIKPHTVNIKKNFCSNFIREREISIDSSAVSELLRVVADLSLQNIKGILNKCYAIAKFEHHIISKTVIKNIIKTECNCDLFVDNIDLEQQKMREVIMKVSSLYSVSYDEVVGNKRSYNAIVARKISVYLIRLITTLTYQQIGKAFGNRNHSTIIQLKTQIDDEIKQDETLKFAIQKLAKIILQQSNFK